jgi:2-polyprenyl-3-methyl-5-hydroxy-6-metoxy-1,4-benzoquinol methylase
MLTLHDFNHGIGDCVQFTSVLRHLKELKPEMVHDIKTSVGKVSTFNNLARYASTHRDMSETYYQQYSHPWSECHHSWPDSPGTKTAKCLRDRYQIVPKWGLLTYSVNVRDEAQTRANTYIASLPCRPFVLIHYEGNTSTDKKNLRHEDVKIICDWLRSHEITPVILDWDRRSPIIDNVNIYCPDRDNDIWQHIGTGDVETIAALTNRAKLFIGIDSGPCKVACATSTPTICVWTKHHPYHYSDNTPNCNHLLPVNHTDYLRGNKDIALKFFEDHYRYSIYPDGYITDYIKLESAKLIGIPHNPMATSSMLTSTAFDALYYEQHKQAGLDYSVYGPWQENYGKWFVEALHLKNKVVLDLGCACGAIASGFARAGALVSGCDVNETMINLGRSQWLESTLKICDASNMHHWKDNTFDFIHSSQVFEHFKPELVPHILDECWRVLKVNGILFVCLDTVEMYERQKRDLANEDATHTCVKPMKWWTELLAEKWEPASDVEAALKSHTGNYFQMYDWDFFIVRKKG